jgi:hypothetical protein
MRNADEVPLGFGLCRGARGRPMRAEFIRCASGVHRLALFFLALPCLIGMPDVAAAQEAPKPQYTLKEMEARNGTRIRREVVSGSRIALNHSYAQLSEEDKRVLHGWWEDIREGDEPPFPVDGLRSRYDPIRKAHAMLLDPGDLFAVATIGPDGKAVEVKVFRAPGTKMGQFAAQVFMLTPFKPALCAGKPCQMDYPLRMKFTVTR